MTLKTTHTRFRNLRNYNKRNPSAYLRQHIALASLEFACTLDIINFYYYSNLSIRHQSIKTLLEAFNFLLLIVLLYELMSQHFANLHPIIGVFSHALQDKVFCYL